MQDWDVDDDDEIRCCGSSVDASRHEASSRGPLGQNSHYRNYHYCPFAIVTIFLPICCGYIPAVNLLESLAGFLGTTNGRRRDAGGGTQVPSAAQPSVRRHRDGRRRNGDQVVSRWPTGVLPSRAVRRGGRLDHRRHRRRVRTGGTPPAQPVAHEGSWCAMRHPLNTPIGRFGIETDEEAPGLCVATMPVHGLANPITGAPALGPLAVLVDQVSGAGQPLPPRRRRVDGDQ